MTRLKKDEFPLNNPFWPEMMKVKKKQKNRNDALGRPYFR